MPHITVPIRFCESCNKQLVLRFYPSGSQESLPEFCKRRFCNRICKGLSQRLPDGPRLGGLPHRGRKIARRKKPRVFCERCNRTNRLEVHHKDENATNNDPSNLEVLCLWCHRQAHKHHGCKVEGCGRPYYGLEYCNKHYRRFKRYGDPLVRCFGHGKPQKVAM